MIIVVIIILIIVIYLVGSYLSINHVVLTLFFYINFVVLNIICAGYSGRQDYCISTYGQGDVFRHVCYRTSFSNNWSRNSTSQGLFACPCSLPPTGWSKITSNIQLYYAQVMQQIGLHIFTWWKFYYSSICKAFPCIAHHQNFVVDFVHFLFSVSNLWDRRLDNRCLY